MPQPATTWATQEGRAGSGDGQGTTPSRQQWRPFVTDFHNVKREAAAPPASRSPASSLKPLSDLNGQGRLAAATPSTTPRPMHSLQLPPLTQDPVVARDDSPARQPMHVATHNAHAFKWPVGGADNGDASSQDDPDNARVCVSVTDAASGVSTPTQTQTQTPLLRSAAQPSMPPPRVEPLTATMEVPSSSTGLRALDARLGGARGLPPGAAVELVGPTASGKTQWAVQMAMRVRLAAIECSDSGDDDAHATPIPARVLVIDTEGSITPALLDKIATSLTSLSPTLAPWLLAGTHLISAPSPARLIATLRILTSPWRHAAQCGIPHLHDLATVVVDSTSSATRAPVDAQTDRATTRRYLLSLLASLHTRIAAINPHTRLIATTQMALKMYTSQGELVNYRVPDSIAWLVPQVGEPLRGDNGDGHGDDDGDDQSTPSGPPGVLGDDALRIVLYRSVRRGDFGSRYLQVTRANAMPTPTTLRFAIDPQGLVTDDEWAG